jgi:hypothetical protein
MRVVVFGSNKWDDEDQVREHLASLPRAGLVLIHGDGPGVSEVVAEWCEHNRVEHVTCVTEWATYGRYLAQRKRNEAMLASGAELALVFRAPGKSGGIDALVAQLRRDGVRVEVVRAVPLNEQVALLKLVLADALEAVESGAPRDECLRILRNA